MYELSELRWQAASFNPQSCRQSHRWHDIFHVLRSIHILGLQGTREPPDVKGQSATVLKKVGEHLVYSWPRGINTHTGVAVGLHTSRFKTKHVRRIFPTPKRFEGRVGVIRVKNKIVDFTPIVVYPPSATSSSSKQFVQSIWEFVGGIANQLPHRTVPLLLTDSNGQIGLEHIGLDASERGATRSEAVGMLNPSLENFNGLYLRRFLETHHMAAINTFFNTEPTFYHNSGEGCTRIDFVGLPSSFIERTQDSYTWTAAGDELQLIECAGRRDHRPAVAVFMYRAHFEPEVATSLSSPSVDPWANAPWDKDALVLGATLGDHRPEFLQVAEQWAEQNADRIQELAMQGQVDQVSSILNGGLAVAARPYRLKKGRVGYIRDDTFAAAQLRRDARLLVSSSPTDDNIAFLNDCSKRVRQLRRRDGHRFQAVLLQDLWDSWHTRSLAITWRIARRLAHHSLGPKKRYFNRPPSCRPSAQEWNTYLSGPAHAGGCSATSLDSEDFIKDDVQCTYLS